MLDTTAITHRGLTRVDCESIADVLHEAPETHHTVWRITDGDDPDRASWYAGWLIDLSDLSGLLAARPVRRHLVHALVQLDRDQDVYARGLVEQFAG